MKKFFFILLIGVCLCGGMVQKAHASVSDVKIAFIKDGNLWLKLNQKTSKITKDGDISTPKWSDNGRWIAYQVGGQSGRINVYDTTKNRFFTITDRGSNYQWAPEQPLLAYQDGKMLKVVDVRSFPEANYKNVTLGVNNYSWLPSGEGFLVSSLSQLLPSGWGPVKLYKVPLNANLDPAKAKLFFTLPKQSEDFFAVGTSRFKWSHNGHWIAFLAYPTASMSADSNNLCVLSADGKQFNRIGNMLLNMSWFNWAPDINWLAYINGEGRFAIKNKHLTVKELPTLTNNVFTPEGYVDWDFDWVGHKGIIVSRAKESDWDNDPKKRPLPKLYYVDMETGKQKQLTNPKKNKGDYNPVIIDENQIYWVRSNRKTAKLLQTSFNQPDANVVIKKFDLPANYYELLRWDEVISIYTK